MKDVVKQISCIENILFNLTLKTYIFIDLKKKWSCYNIFVLFYKGEILDISNRKIPLKFPIYVMYKKFHHFEVILLLCDYNLITYNIRV